VSTATITADPLVVRGVVFGLYARLLAEDVEPLASDVGVDELRAALEAAGETEALAMLEPLDRIDHADAGALSGRWVRLFDQGRVSPHETSYIPVGVGGHTPVLADTAGFYRALGVKLEGQRPDHVVGQLEFASLTCLAEAHHRAEGRDDVADTCAQVMWTFLRDHLGCWLDRFAAKLLAADPAGPWGPVVASADRFVVSECQRRGVRPAQPHNLFVSEPGLGVDDSLEDEMPDCSTGGF
jgi:nitrate reductase assembly molybdenum cofactor insertion protein NarJ